MKVALVIHFRDDAAGSRRAAFEVTKDVVSNRYRFDDILVVDSGHERYNRAASRNYGVRLAEERGCDVVVLNDADSIPESVPLTQAIEGAYADGLMHFPFNEVWYLVPKATARIKTTPLVQLRNRALHRTGPSNGGVWVCRPDVWWKTGGQDERIAGYGAEDRAHLAATRTLVGESVVHEGVLLCAYHDRELGPTETWNYDDVQLMERYHHAFGNPEATQALIDEWRR